MQEWRGNIWERLASDLIVLPTNIGWTRTGANPMGAGMAKFARDRFSGLDSWYGLACQEHRAATPVLRHPNLPLILFPTKPLDETSPWLSWRSDSCLVLIERSAQQLAEMVFTQKVALPLVGCGNGRLTESEVMPILEKYLNRQDFILVRS